MVQKSTKRYMLYRAVGSSENLWGGDGKYLGSHPIQRDLNRLSQFLEQKLRFFSKVKILKNAFNKK